MRGNSVIAAGAEGLLRLAAIPILGTDRTVRFRITPERNEPYAAGNVPLDGACVIGACRAGNGMGAHP